MLDETPHFDALHWRIQQAANQRLIRSRRGTIPTYADLWELFGQLRCEGYYGPISNRRDRRGVRRPFEVVVVDATGALTTQDRFYRLPGVRLPDLQIGRTFYGPSAVATMDACYSKVAAGDAIELGRPVDTLALTNQARRILTGQLLREPRDRKAINLSGCGMDDGDLAVLGSFTQLERLDLSWNQIRGNEFDRLKTLRSLKSLELHNNPFQWEHLPSLANVLGETRTLRRLTLPGQFRDRVDVVRELFPWLSWTVQ